ncbi:cyclase dehydrase [Falsiroseomonas oryziterrae]|uniref:cyclase dehydrase n=1 Tax=Falsiroseomonas oryziterrae TaxID=2911368 RepID=UPI001F3A7737|nr:cyclase dehydrase [Roseomonas sp. NPKOSM-4]
MSATATRDRKGNGMRSRSAHPRRLVARGSAGRMAGGLGWFSIGLGVAEIAAARPIARALGLRGAEALIRAYGVREIVTGLGILGATDRRPWIRGRVAGDALDLVTLLAGAPRASVAGFVTALGSVATVTLFDLVCAEALRTEESDRAGSRRAARANASRTAFPRGVEASRGIARDVTVPQDVRIPDPLRPQAQPGLGDAGQGHGEPREAANDPLRSSHSA